MQSKGPGRPQRSLLNGRPSYEAEESTRSYDRISFRRGSSSFEPRKDPTDLLDKHTRLHLEWSDVSADAPVSKGIRNLFKGPSSRQRLIDGISGRAGPGEIFGIIGPVGSGKSTLLKVLAGKFTGTVYGWIRVNGILRDHRWKHCIALVDPSNDCLQASQTVLESLRFIAELCIPKRFGEAEIQTRIDHVIRLMALEKIKDDTIGDLDSTKVGISGGERRRLLIAHKLLLEPRLLILDEPTSGLDSTSANVLMNFLHQLAIIDSITIVLTVQQPRMSILTKFEHLLVLQGGAPVFCGSIDGAVEYFEELGYVYEQDNLAEFMLDAVTGKRVQSQIRNLTCAEFKEHWRANRHEWLPPITEATLLTDEAKRKWTKKASYNGSWWKAYLMTWKRQHTLSVRDGNYLVFLFWASLLLGLYSGFVWFQMSKTEFEGIQDRLGLLYLIPRATILFTAAPVCFFNKAGVRHERELSLYRCSASYFGLLSFFFPAGFLIYLAVYIPAYYISGLRYSPFSAFLTFIGFQYLNVLVFLPLGFLVASLCPTYEASISILVFLLMVFRLFGGFSVNLREMTPILSWLRFLSPAYYVYTGTVGNEFSGKTFAGETGGFWLNLYGLDLLSVIWCAGALMIYGAGIIVLGYFAWEWATRPTFNLKTISPTV